MVTESGLVVARGCGEGTMGSVTAQWVRVSFWG